MSNIICVAIPREQESAKSSSGRVIARRDVEFEEMKGGEDDKEAWSAPQGVEGGLELDDGQCQGYTKGCAQEECAEGDGGRAFLRISDRGDWCIGGFWDMAIAMLDP